MRDRARVVIVGGGIAGASVAYHLAQLGWRDVVVLEQGGLVSGTTSHAPGLIGQLRSSPALMKLLMYSVSLYRGLSLDGVPGFLGEGSLRVASSRERLAQLRRSLALAGSVGLEAHLLTPQEAGRLFPLMSLEGVEGALYLPGDGSATAPVLAGALIKEARARGVAFCPNTQVRGIEVSGGRVRGVQTGAGLIETETLVVCSGIWSPRLGRLAGVALPLTPMQHQYAMTGPLPELAGKTLPNLRDPDKLVYLRQKGQSLVIGGYEPDPRPLSVEDIPERPEPTVLPFDAAHFEVLRRGMVERVPALASAGFERTVNGLESFTIDGEFLLGPAPAVAGFWSACGFCAHGISGAGGVGQVLAEWIVHGDPGLDVADMALARFRGQALDAAAVRRGASSVYGTYYALPQTAAR